MQAEYRDQYQKRKKDYSGQIIAAAALIIAGGLSLAIYQENQKAAAIEERVRQERGIPGGAVTCPAPFAVPCPASQKAGGRMRKAIAALALSAIALVANAEEKPTLRMVKDTEAAKLKAIIAQEDAKSKSKQGSGHEMNLLKSRAGFVNGPDTPCERARSQYKKSGEWKDAQTIEKACAEATASHK